MEVMLNRIADYLQTQSWQIGVLVAAVALVSWVLRRRSAHVRYLLWLVVLAKCLVPPVVNVPLPVLPERQSRLLSPAVPPPATGMPATRAPVEMRPMPTARPTPAPVRPRLSTRQWLAIAWLAGAGVFASVAAFKAGWTTLWLRRQRRVIPHDLQTNLGCLLSSPGLKRLPRMWLIEGVGQPFVWGVVRGAIYLPYSFVRVKSDEHRSAILGHELSHVLRFDAAVNVLQIVAQAIFWFHPLVWWANKRMRAEREKSCDEMALARLGTAAKDYSKAIVDTLLQEQESTRRVPSLAIAGPVKNIEERIRTMLRPGKKFYTHPSLVAATVTILLALLIVPTALVLTARAQEPASSHTTSNSTVTLLHASANGDIEQVRQIIAQGADVNFKNKDGETAASLAMENWHTDVVKLLVSKGAQVTLDLAAYLGDLPKVKGFIESDPNIGENELNRLLSLTLDSSSLSEVHRDVAEYLLDKGANPNAKDKNDATLLHRWAWGGNPDVTKAVMQILIDRGADTNALQLQDDCRWTPLHSACAQGRASVARFLIEHGADIDAIDKWGFTPIDYAMHKYQTQLVQFLVDRGAKVSRPHIAAYFGRLGELETLLEDEGSIDANDGAGFTPLLCAVCGRQERTMEYLLSRGPNVNAQNHWHYTALHYASDRGRRDWVEQLLARGADVNLRTIWGGNALFFPAAHGRLDIVELLYGHGASISIKDDDNNRTALQVASERGHREVVEFLLDKGADVNAKDNEGNTALDLAKQQGHADIVELLKQHGAK